MNGIDISDEAWRTYVFPDKGEYTVVRPATLSVRFLSDFSEQHTITDVNGNEYVIQPGWRVLRTSKKRELTDYEKAVVAKMNQGDSEDSSNG